MTVADLPLRFCVPPPFRQRTARPLPDSWTFSGVSDRSGNDSGNRCRNPAPGGTKR